MPRVKRADERRAEKQAREQAKRQQDEAEELRGLIDEYFEDCDLHHQLYGPAGLALALDMDFADLIALRDNREKPALSKEIRRAFLRMQNQIETAPQYREKGGMATRAIFALKQPWFGGYQDRSETKQDVNLNIVFGDGMDKSDME